MCGVESTGIFWCIRFTPIRPCTASLECADDAGDGPRREAQMTWFFGRRRVPQRHLPLSSSRYSPRCFSVHCRFCASMARPLSTLHKMVVRVNGCLISMRSCSWSDDRWPPSCASAMWLFTALHRSWLIVDFVRRWQSGQCHASIDVRK